MKKSLIFLCMLVSIFILSVSKTYAMHSTYRNLISVWNLKDVNSYIVGTKTPISITPGATYTVVVDYTQIASEFLDDYNNDGSPIPLRPSYQGLSSSDYPEVIIDDVKKFIYIEFDYDVDAIDIIMPESFSERFMFYLGTYEEFKGFYPYQKSEDSFNNQIRIPVEQTITENYLLNLVKFEVGGTPIGEVTMDLRGFDVNAKKITNHDIVYMVTHQNETTIVVLNLDIYDDEPPKLTSGSEIEINYTDQSDLNTLLQTIRYTDNFTPLSHIEREIISDNYTSNKGKVGSYVVKMQLTDQNGNSATYDITINVISTVGPTISGDSRLRINTQELNDLTNYLKNQYSAKSNPEKEDVLVTFEIPNNIPNTKHTFTVKVSATDKYGNTRSRNIEILLIPTESNVGIVLSELIIKTTTTNKLDEKDIINQVAKELEGKEEYENISIISNNYEGSEDVSGIYQVGVKYQSDGVEKTSYIAVEVSSETFSFDNYIEFIVVGAAVLMGFVAFMTIKHVNLKKKLKNK